MKRRELLKRKAIYYQGYKVAKEYNFDTLIAEKLVKSARENDASTFMKILLHKWWEYEIKTSIDEIIIYGEKERKESMRLFTIGVLNALIN